MVDTSKQNEWQGNEYFINYDKARDACSIVWISDVYNISDLEPYLCALQCDDGENFHELLHADWPNSAGRDDFRLVEIENFAALEGDYENHFLLCFTAVVSINLDNHPTFRKALEIANNKIVARIGFKENGHPILDENGDEEILYEMDQDTFVDLEPDD